MKGPFTLTLHLIHPGSLSSASIIVNAALHTRLGLIRKKFIAIIFHSKNGKCCKCNVQSLGDGQNLIRALNYKPSFINKDRMTFSNLLIKLHVLQPFFCVRTYVILTCCSLSKETLECWEKIRLYQCGFMILFLYGGLTSVPVVDKIFLMCLGKYRKRELTD